MMPKHKHGRHATSLTTNLRGSVRTLSELPGVDRVLVGHIRAGRGKSHEHGHIQIQRTDQHTIHAVGFGDTRLFEITILINPTNSPEEIAGQINELWPPVAKTRNYFKKSRHGGTGPNRIFRSSKYRQSGVSIGLNENSGATLADIWPKRS